MRKYAISTTIFFVKFLVFDFTYYICLALLYYLPYVNFCKDKTFF